MAFFSNHIIQRAERWSLRLGSRFRKDENGATAVEFAFVALPFFMLLFGILELAIVFFVNSALVHATSEAGRVLRTGNFQACGGQDEFKALVCENMKGMASCWKNVRVDVVQGDSFKTIALPGIPDPVARVAGQTGQAAIPQTPNGQFDANAAGDMLVVRSTFYYPLALPPVLTRLDIPKGSGVHTMTSTTAFRNEPFPASGTCDPNTQSQISDGTP
jgi:Flp pilus assembly protein TadG